MCVLLRVRGTEGSKVGPAPQPQLASTGIVRGGEIATHLYSLPGSPYAYSWGPALSCCTDQQKGVTVRLVCLLSVSRTFCVFD